MLRHPKYEEGGRGGKSGLIASCSHPLPSRITDEESSTYIINGQLGVLGGRGTSAFGGQPRLPWFCGSFDCIVFAMEEAKEGGIASFEEPFPTTSTACQVIDVIHQHALQHLGYLQQNLGENRRL
jgi:hypothetical protein